MMKVPPSYLKLVVNKDRTLDKEGPSDRRVSDKEPAKPGQADVVHLVSQENQVASGSEITTVHQAESLLAAVTNNMAEFDVAHYDLDRQRIWHILGE